MEVLDSLGCLPHQSELEISVKTWKKWYTSSFKSNAFSITAVGLGHLLTWSGSHIRKTSLWSILFQTEHPNNVYLKKQNT